VTSPIIVAGPKSNIRDSSVSNAERQVAQGARDAFARILSDIPESKLEAEQDLKSEQDQEIDRGVGHDRYRSTGRPTATVGKALRWPNRTFDEIAEKELVSGLSAPVPRPQEQDATTIIDVSQVAPHLVTARHDFELSATRISTPDSLASPLRRGPVCAVREQEHNDAVEEGAPLATIEVSHQETHFAPVTTTAKSFARMPPEQDATHAIEAATEATATKSRTIERVDGDTVSQPPPIWSQVADATVSLLATELDDHGGTIAVGNLQPDNVVSRSPVRLVKLQLTPDALGTIDVLLSTSKGALSIRLHAHIAQVAGQLQEERTLLSERLESCGHRLAELSIAALAVPQDEVLAPNRSADDRASENLGTSNDGNRESQFHSSRDQRSSERRQNDSDPSAGRAPRTGVVYAEVSKFPDAAFCNGRSV
jgi:hypothetical protein